jgi:hypothetical protein
MGKKILSGDFSVYMKGREWPIMITHIAHIKMKECGNIHHMKTTGNRSYM